MTTLLYVTRATFTTLGTGFHQVLTEAEGARPGLPVLSALDFLRKQVFHFVVEFPRLPALLLAPAPFGCICCRVGSLAEKQIDF